MYPDIIIVVLKLIRFSCSSDSMSYTYPLVQILTKCVHIWIFNQLSVKYYFPIVKWIFNRLKYFKSSNYNYLNI